MTEKEPTTTFTGRIRKVLFRANGFAVLLMDDGSKAAGNMHAEPDLGRVYVLSGEWTTHERFGDQFKFESYKAEVPRGKAAIAAYLRDTCSYIGPVRVARILEVFGDEALSVLKCDPARVAREINGLSLQQAQIVANQLAQHDADEALEIGLRTIFEGVRIRKSIIGLCIDRWQHETCEVIKSNPFLLTEFSGVGFLTADQVARKVGFPHDGSARVRAGLLHVLEDATSSGHCFLPRCRLLELAAKLLGLAQERVGEELDPMHADAVVTIEKDDVYLPKIYVAERAVARDLAERSAGTVFAPPANLDGLSDDQREAVDVILASRVALMTGNPGTGKSYSLKRVIEAFKPNEVAICAPTGKAARRIRELTGWDALTIHKLLEPLPVGDGWHFQRNADNPIPQSVVVVDEVSMVPIMLMASLLSAMRPDARLILTGDPDQLPSVGAGAVLRDLMASRVVAHAQLREIHRQAAGSRIIQACHAIHAGREPEINNRETDDLFFIQENDPSRLATTLVELVYNRLPSKYRFDPLADIQVITGHRDRTNLSAKALNSLMQARRLADAGQAREEKRRFYVGDKVMQTANGIFEDEISRRGAYVANGDIGIVRAVDKARITVDFDAPDRRIAFQANDNDLDLAYAVTVHKFQGSQAKCIVIPIHASTSYRVLQKSWLYTAVSRAEKLCVIVGSRAEAAECVRRSDQEHRNTRLCELLRERAFGSSDS